MIELSLMRRESDLAEATAQRQVLEAASPVPPFQQMLKRYGDAPLSATGLETLQINVGKLCNQTCTHCHVDAGPDWREMMSREVAAACLNLLRQVGIPILDITGGAPEMNPHFRWLVEDARQMGCRVIDRCNLTILVTPGFEDLPEFLASHEVEIVASLPCYLENVDKQRGNRVFQRSIDAIRQLNTLGYGMPGENLPLTLVFNPGGPSLPPPQHSLEEDYRTALRDRYGVEFTRLFTITNMPISRFLDSLLATGRLDEYMQTLFRAFNPQTLTGVMCRSMLSVDWLGRLYDCDFNQMLNLELADNLPRNILDLDEIATKELRRRRIITGQHCFGCTAGEGSSCQGSLQSVSSERPR
jgi:radical SAM/Cys-rich protein